MFVAASVHGRFQPFHNEHLEYALAAKQGCAFLWIGITKFDVSPDDASPLARHRQRPENNPFTYFERVVMIAEALVEAGVGRDSFGFVPFPIETPRRLTEFIVFSDIICPNHQKHNLWMSSIHPIIDILVEIIDNPSGMTLMISIFKISRPVLKRTHKNHRNFPLFKLLI